MRWSLVRAQAAVVTRLRLDDPFVVAPPAKAIARTRLRPSEGDEELLLAVGRHLGSLLRSDVAARCRLGPGAKHLGRAERKRRLTPECSSRWAGAITRTADEMYALGVRNLKALAERDSREIAEIDRRAALPTAARRGDAPNPKGRKRYGYANQAERHHKQRRRHKLAARLTDTRQRLDEGRVSITVGGRALARKRHNLDAAGMTLDQWRRHWNARRMFLTADGESGKAWGNETIRVAPDTSCGARPGDCTITVRPPEPLAHLSNTGGRAPTYRLSAPLRWNHRADEWAARARSGLAIAYTVALDPRRGRWYITAAWSQPVDHPPTVAEAAASGRCLAIDVNAGHLDARILDVHGNPVGAPTVEHIPQRGTAAHRLGSLREAVARLIKWGKDGGASFAAIEALDFADARALGRQQFRRGTSGRTTRRKVCGIPTAQFTHAISSAAQRHQMPVVAVDAAYTSRWGRRWWQQPLNQSRRQRGDGHAAAAVVIGRRSQGHSEKRRRRMHPQRPEDRQRRTSAEPTADTTGMATATGNDECEYPRDATTTRTDTRPAARTGAQHRSGRRRQNNHLSA